MNEFLQRLNPFEGLCLTAEDLSDEQSYHRQSLQIHRLRLHGYGIVQGLQVSQNQQSGDSYEIILKSGFGIAQNGDGINVPFDTRFSVSLPKRGGKYALWLVRHEVLNEDDLRPRFDTAESHPARVVEAVKILLLKGESGVEDGVMLRRVNIRGQQLQLLHDPVPRAGKQDRMAESYYKPTLIEFIELNRKIIDLLYRARKVSELEIEVMSFNTALISTEFLLIEEGTSDRVLYRGAGSLIKYANSFYSKTISVPELGDLPNQIRAQATTPSLTDSTQQWKVWFQTKFRTILSELRDVATRVENNYRAQQ